MSNPVTGALKRTVNGIGSWVLGSGPACSSMVTVSALYVTTLSVEVDWSLGKLTLLGRMYGSTVPEPVMPDTATSYVVPLPVTTADSGPGAVTLGRNMKEMSLPENPVTA